MVRMLFCLMFPSIALVVIGLNTDGLISEIVQGLGLFIGAVLQALFIGMSAILGVFWSVIRFVLPFFAAGAVGVMMNDLHKASVKTRVHDAMCVAVAAVSAFIAIVVSGYNVILSTSLLFGVYCYLGAIRRPEKSVSYSLFLFFFGSVIWFATTFFVVFVVSDLTGKTHVKNLEEIYKVYTYGSAEEQQSMDQTLRIAITQDPQRSLMRSWLMDEGLLAKNISTNPEELKIPYEYRRDTYVLTCSRKDGQIYGSSGPASYDTRAIQLRLCIKRAAEFEPVYNGKRHLDD